MLRITQLDTDETLTLVFEGSLGGDWVPEAVRVWDEVLRTSRRAEIVVDLRGVRYVSPTGRELLAAMHSTGAKLVGSGTLLGSLIEEISKSDTGNEQSQTPCEEKP